MFNNNIHDNGLVEDFVGWNVVAGVWPVKKKTSKIILPKLAREA